MPGLSVNLTNLLIPGVIRRVFGFVELYSYKYFNITIDLNLDIIYIVLHITNLHITNYIILYIVLHITNYTK